MCEEAVYDVVALGELLIDFTPVSTDGAGCPTLKANPGGAHDAPLKNTHGACGGGTEMGIVPLNFHNLY